MEIKLNKKEILLGIFSGFFANIVGTLFSVIILFQDIKISNSLRIVSNSISDNFKDLTIPPVNTYPAQVRSDVKDYLRNFGDGVFIGRAQFD